MREEDHVDPPSLLLSEPNRSALESAELDALLNVLASPALRG